jgi:hypothetical protein
MPGNDRVRFCTLCQLNVYNLSDMSREEAEAFVTSREGPGCVRFYRREDGTIQTRDCPRALGLLASGSRYAAARLACFALFLLSLLFATTHRGFECESRTPLRSVEPFKTVMDWLDPPPKTPPPGTKVNAGKPGWTVGRD